jgi:hypothetical protein
VGKRLSDQPAVAECARIQHVGNSGTVSSIHGRLAMDTLVTALGGEIRAILIQLPLKLLDSGDATVIE